MRGLVEKNLRLWSYKMYLGEGVKFGGCGLGISKIDTNVEFFIKTLWFDTVMSSLRTCLLGGVGEGRSVMSLSL